VTKFDSLTDVARARTLDPGELNQSACAASPPPAGEGRADDIPPVT